MDLNNVTFIREFVMGFQRASMWYCQVVSVEGVFSTDHLSIPPMRCPFGGFNDVLGVFFKGEH
jgi:hypothetical protein